MFKYSYYDEVGTYIAIVSEDTTSEEIEKLKKQGKYDEVNFKE